jgi:hypothetical protein
MKKTLFVLSLIICSFVVIESKQLLDEDAVLVEIDNISMASSEGGGSTTMDCFAGDEIGTQRFPQCQYGCPYANMGDPRKVGTCTHSW